METKSIMIVGVGGQGTLLASRLIGNALISTGCDVKLSEVHGMSQRGGSVVTYVKYGDKVHSPLIDLGEADYILSFEALEAGRFLPYLRKGGTIITNTALKYYRKYAFHVSTGTPMVIAELGNDAGMYGCVKMILG